MIVVKNGKILFDSLRRVHDPVNMVELAFQSEYKVSKMSQQLGVSPRHLERMFYDSLGVSPKYWLRQERMIRARHLVREGFPLKHISVFLGFRRYSHFISEVRAFYDMPPVQLVDVEKRRCAVDQNNKKDMAIAS